MIEVYDIKDAEPENLDITPELALAAYNTLIQFCKQQEASDDGTCNQCIQYYAGHKKPDTTMMYITVSEENVRASFRRYIA